MQHIAIKKHIRQYFHPFVDVVFDINYHTLIGISTIIDIKSRLILFKFWILNFIMLWQL